jgi:addiction module HigA family antidote
MKPITPGEILLEDYLKPMGISQNALARAIGVSPRSINEIVLSRRSISPEMSMKLGVFFRQLMKRSSKITARVKGDYLQMAA